jgi:hypothetical protein
VARDFHSATAEQVVSAIECVFVTQGNATVDLVAEFADLPLDQAKSALKLAEDLGFLVECTIGEFIVQSPLCRFVSSPNLTKKAAVLRIALEDYEPFRERLIATESASSAAQQTKALLSLNAHREQIKDTLLSLGTYSYALAAEGGGRYRPNDESLENVLETAAKACIDASAAEVRVREQVGEMAASLLSVDEVIRPLADALVRVAENDPRGAVVVGGNAIESFLDYIGQRTSTSLVGKTGINAKLDSLARGSIPRKLVNMGKYIGHIRNGADHGIDPDIQASWSIGPQTAVEFVFVCYSFIRATCDRIEGRPPVL